MASFVVEVRDYVAGEFTVGAYTGTMVTFGDVCVGSDFVGRTVSFHVSPVDVAEVGEFVRKDALKFHGDVGKGVDFVRKVSGKVVSDLGRVGDWLARLLTKSCVEAVVSVDRLKRESVKVLADAVVSSDLAGKSVLKGVFDYAVGEFGHSVILPREFRDGVVSVDYMCKDVVKPFWDGSVGVDYFAKSVLKWCFDLGVALDFVGKALRLRLADVGLTSDYMRKVPYKLFRDVAVSSDYMCKLALKVMADSAVSMDFFGRVINFVRRFADLAVSADFIGVQSSFVRALMDVGKGLDFARKGVGKVSFDSSLVADWVSRGLMVNFFDVGVVLDFLRRERVVLAFELGKVSDVMERVYGAVRAFVEPVYTEFGHEKGVVDVERDAGVSVDYIVKSIFKVGVEVSYVVDWVSRAYLKALADLLLSADVLEKYASHVRTFMDVGLSVDYLFKETSKRIMDTAFVADWFFKDLVKAFRDLVFGIDFLVKQNIVLVMDVFKYVEAVEKGMVKSVGDYVAGEFDFSKTAEFHLSYIDVSKGVDFISKDVVSSLVDLLVGLDFVAKDLVSLVYDGVFAVDWLMRDVAVCIYDFSVGLEYLSKSVVSNILDAGHVSDWILLPAMKIVAVFDSLYPEFVISKDAVKVEVDSALAVDWKLVKDVVRHFADYVVGLDRAIRVRIVEVFDRVFHEFDIAKEMSKLALDRLVPVDVVAKVAYTLMGYGVRRVYSIPRPLADIIESADHNTKVLVCQALIAAVKSLKDKLSE